VYTFFINQGVFHGKGKVSTYKGACECRNHWSCGSWKTTLTAAITRVMEKKGLAKYVSYDEVAKASESQGGETQQKY